MGAIEDIEARLNSAVTLYQEAGDLVSEVSLLLITVIALEHVPDATVVVLDDSDQEGTEYTFGRFENAQGAIVFPADEEAVDLMWGPVSNLQHGDVLGYRIDLTHLYAPDPEGKHGPDRCRHDGLPAENARHRQPCRSGHTDCTTDCGWCKGTGVMRAPRQIPG